MSKALEILAVAGFQIKLGDGAKFWELVDAVDQLENTNVTERTWNPDDASGFKDEDLLGKDVVICYSWGVASVFKAFARMKATGTLHRVPLLIILAGVPRGVAQCVAVTVDGGWIVPPEVDEAVCLQVNSFPVSHPIANSSETRVNILITGIPGNDHVGIENYPAARSLILNMIEAASQAIV